MKALYPKHLDHTWEPLSLKMAYDKDKFYEILRKKERYINVFLAQRVDGHESADDVNENGEMTPYFLFLHPA